MFNDFPRRDVRGGDTGIHAEFYIDAVELTFKSKQTGKPEFEDREFVRIFVAGDKHNIIEREAHDGDRQRFSENYRRFKEGIKDAAQSGTPLSAWPAMTPALIRAFNANSVFTVEQLASLSENGVQSGPLGSREWSKRAQGYLAHAADTAAASRLQVELDRKDQQIADLQRQLTEIAQRLPARQADDDIAEAPRRRGRPPRAQAA
jgi:hypothetical protein